MESARAGRFFYEGGMRSLDQLKPGDRAKIRALKQEGGLAQRLMEMGLLEGDEVELIRVAPMGDPLEIRVGDYHLSLRKSEAKLVELE